MQFSKIEVKQLHKTYHVPQREAGFKASVRSLFRPIYQDVPAVKPLDFVIESGEMVALIGPNGAGKTTTLKMLTGLLHPSGGDINIFGFNPSERKPAFLRSISMVLGNKSQMLWDIPPLDSFFVLAEIYSIPKEEAVSRINELVEMLEMREILKKPVRNLSLGERMKCELVASLLHRPKVLFLDEPTLGLDINIQNRLRHFILEYNHRYGATVLLTSHYMADIERLCSRVLLIHHGELLYDGQLSGLNQMIEPIKMIRVTLSQQNGVNPKPDWLPASAEIVSQEKQHLHLRVAQKEAAACTAALLHNLPVADLIVEDPPLETVIDRIYQDGDL
ncbi:MAG: ABC transporter [Anaerolineaceae bacterium]|nr:ABC transporter [Anaerolineaceae bacterium]